MTTAGTRLSSTVTMLRVATWVEGPCTRWARDAPTVQRVLHVILPLISCVLRIVLYHCWIWNIGIKHKDHIIVFLLLMFMAEKYLTFCTQTFLVISLIEFDKSPWKWLILCLFPNCQNVLLFKFIQYLNTHVTYHVIMECYKQQWLIYYALILFWSMFYSNKLLFKNHFKQHFIHWTKYIPVARFTYCSEHFSDKSPYFVLIWTGIKSKCSKMNKIS